jgi:DNA-binding CsgD family transcriptional regulator
MIHRQLPFATNDLRCKGGDMRGYSNVLTKQQQAVCDLVMEGLGNKAIARQLGLSPRTIEDHKLSVYRKMGVSNGIQLVRKIFERRIEELVSSHSDTASGIVGHRPTGGVIDGAGGTRLEDARRLAEQFEHTA